jgi:Ca2+-binding RTX toxin-like protein
MHAVRCTHPTGLRRGAALGLITGLAALAAAAPATASSLRVDSGGTLRFTAAAGEDNRLDATDTRSIPPAMSVTDTGSVIDVGAGCTAVSEHEALCPYDAGRDQPMVVDLRDGDDTARIFKYYFGTVWVDGGTGDDTIEDDPQSGAVVDGGPGADTVTAYPNFGGRVELHGGPGPDHLMTRSASGTLAGDAGDDRIEVLTFVEPGPGFPAAVDGGPGDDTISASGPSFFTLMSGGPGADALTSEAGAVVHRMDGGPDADTISQSAATPSPSTIDAGSGPDTVDGGGGGDVVDCGAGADRYVAYAGDTVTRCETAFTRALRRWWPRR